MQRKSLSRERPDYWQAARESETELVAGNGEPKLLVDLP